MSLIKLDLIFSQKDESRYFRSLSSCTTRCIPFHWIFMQRNSFCWGWLNPDIIYKFKAAPFHCCAALCRNVLTSAPFVCVGQISDHQVGCVNDEFSGISDELSWGGFIGNGLDQKRTETVPHMNIGTFQLWNVRFITLQVTRPDMRQDIGHLRL